MIRGTLIGILGVGLFAARAGAQPAVPPAAPVNPAAPVAAAPGSSAADAGVTDRALPDRASPMVQGIEPEPGGLTANEVVRRTLAASPTVKQKRAQVTAANEKITQTMIQFFPRLTLLASYTRTSNVEANLGGALVGALNGGPLSTNCPAGTTTGCGVVDSQGIPVRATPFVIAFPQNNYVLNGHLSIPLSDYVLRLADASAASSASKEAARLDVAAERLKVETDARTLYLNWLRARAQAAIARSSVESTRARLADARSTFAVGAISKADLLRIEALVANTELTLDRSESLENLTTGQLAILMEDWHPNYHVGESIPDPSTVPDADQPTDRLIAEAMARRLEVRSMDENVRSLTRGASAMRAGALPRVEGVGDVTYANPNPLYFPPTQAWHATWSAGVRATWTIDDIFTNSSAARELDANAQAMIAGREALRGGVAAEVLSAALDLQRARAALDKEHTALAAAQEAYRVTTDLFRAGRATGTDLIASETELLDAKLGDVNARIDLAIAAITLRHVTGRDIAASNAVARD